jgi:endonuclease-3 related protein
MDLFLIYKKMLGHFGPQDWWPIFDVKSGKCEYRGCENYSDRDRFEVCVGAILTQNTAWKNAERALANLSAAGCLSPRKVCLARNLAKLIKPAGYYNQKAKKLKIFAKYWLDKSLLRLASGTPFKKGRKQNLPLCKRGMRGDFLENRAELLFLWGIGPETADSMLLYAFNRPVFVIDAYTKRLCKYYGIEFKTYDEYRKFFESRLPRSAKLYNEFHALIVAWGKMHGGKQNRAAAAKIIN